MHRQPQIVIIAIELGLMAGTSDELVHRLQFEIAFGKEIIESHGRHIQEAFCIEAITIEEIVTGSYLQAVQDKITALHITTQIIIGFVYFLTFGKPTCI